MPLYFAYGSNLCKRQMLTGMDDKPARCPGARPVGKAQLTCWRYLICLRGYANIVPEPAREVWGGVWEVTEEHLFKLDGYEGVQRGLYRRELVDVVMESGQVMRCTAYIDANEGGALRGVPSSDYQDRIIEGANDFGLPEAYIAFLESFRGERG